MTVAWLHLDQHATRLKRMSVVVVVGILVIPVNMTTLLQYAVGCRACLFVCSDLLAVSEFVFSLLMFCDFRENGNRCAVTQIE